MDRYGQRKPECGGGPEKLRTKEIKLMSFPWGRQSTREYAGFASFSRSGRLIDEPAVVYDTPARALGRGRERDRDRGGLTDV